MRQQSEDEEGFIPSGFEVNKKVQNITHLNPKNNNHLTKTYYRYSGYFIKKEHPLSLSTPLTLTHETVVQPAFVARHKPKIQSQHPCKFYCGSSEFYQVYNKHSDQPFVYESEFIKNEISLFNIEDRNSPSLKQLKPFQEEAPQKMLKVDDLIFDSKFQSGNLHCVFRRKETNQYHLFMENDTNTLGYNQWFYFSIRNMRKNVKYWFCIVNYRKRLRFFEQGQRIVMFSRIDAEEHKNGWRRIGNNYSLELTPFSSSLQKQFYTLSFSVQFPHNNDYVALASSLPYSYTKLLQELSSIQNQAKKNTTVRVSIENIGTTICNNQVPEVTITSRNSQKKEKDKKMIVVMGRQHPGEVWSSYKAEGFIKAFLKDTPDIRYILQHYIVKVIPMVNVDGVIYGNFRCDVTGVDLNRRWKYPSHIFHPHLFSIKKKLISYSKKWKIELCIDLHGHSKKYNIFCYACKHNSYTCRILPYLIERQSQIFHMPSCTFGLSKDKQSTARATISKMIKSENVLTLQTSTFGWMSSTNPKQFNPLDLFKFMQSLCTALCHFLDKNSVSYREANKDVHKKINQFYKYDEQNQQESGSESEPEQDQIDFKIKLSTIFDKKYQTQFKSFQDCPEIDQLNAQQNLIQTIVHQQKQQESESLVVFQKIEKILKSPENNQRRESITNSINNDRKSIAVNSIRQGTNKITHSLKSGVHSSQNQRIKNVKTASKNFITREKRKISLNIDEKSHLQISTLNPRTVGQTRREIAKPASLQQIDKKDFSILVEKKQQKQTNLFVLNQQKTKEINELREEGKELAIRWKVYQQRQINEDKQQSDSFFSRFQRYVPLGTIHKTNARLDLLEEGLQNDDSSYQLNLMFENKRKLQLQKLQRTREDSLFLEGKARRELKRQPVAAFGRLKHTERLKQQMRRLQELSHRDYQSQL